MSAAIESKISERGPQGSRFFVGEAGGKLVIVVYVSLHAAAGAWMLNLNESVGLRIFNKVRVSRDSTIHDDRPQTISIVGSQ